VLAGPLRGLGLLGAAIAEPAPNLVACSRAWLSGPESNSRRGTSLSPAPQRGHGPVKGRPFGLCTARRHSGQLRNGIDTPVSEPEVQRAP
jgi:hypothetical protein